jgi:filamentous hemagglutinin family protein
MASTNKSLFACLLFLLAEISLCKRLHAQLIIPAQDGVNTTVSQTGTVFNIDGGVTSRNGVNLFHSFQRFGLDTNQTANFRSTPGIQNIISRDVGGAPSLINGLVQVTGSNANLFLINPAGILLGSDARLNVPAAFMATTANGIGFGSNWFNAIGTNDYASLGSAPSSFAFTIPQPGAIVNAGNLTVGAGQQLTLLGGTVINTGQLSAPGGQITIAAVPGENLVRISQQGSLLSLELQSLTSPAPLTALPFSPLSLPQLLTGGGGHATGVTIENGVVKLVGSGVTIPTAPGTTIVSNQINVAGARGGTVHVLGTRVGLVNAEIEAAGTYGGGTVLIGGDYQGKGIVPNANLTFIDTLSTINADALLQGSGGKVVVWADETTQFNGRIDARGGTQAGNGGLVEVSGKENLAFQGQVDTSAPNGATGTLLLDPFNITIVAGSGGTPDNDQEFLLGRPLAGTGNYSISQQALQTLATRTTFTLQADNNITIQNLNGNTLNLPQTTGTFAFIAGNTFSMNPSNTITTQGAGIRIQAGNEADIGGIVAGGSIDLVSDQLNFLGGADSIRPPSGVSAQISLGTVSPDRLVRVEDNNNSTDKNNSVLDIHVGELAAIQQQSFTQLVIQGGEIDITRDFPNGSPIFPFRTKLVLEARNTVTIDDSVVPSLTVPALEIRASNIALPNVPGVIQAGSVTLGTPRNTTQSIVVGASPTALTGDLNINQQTLDAITTPDLQSLTLETGGNITVTQPVTTNTNLNFRLQGDFTLLQPAITSGGNFSVNTSGTIQATSPVRTQGGDITLNGATVTTGLLDSRNPSGQGGAINLQAQTGSVVTGDLNSSGQQGGRITVQGAAGITTGAINSSGSVFNGGAVNLNTIGAVDVNSINTQGGTQGTGGDIEVEFVDARGGDAGQGGSVDVNTNGRFRAQGTFSVDGIATSIATGGGLRGGDIRIKVAGNQVNVPFIVGDASVNGTQGAISTGADNVILPRQTILGIFTQVGQSGTIQITSGTRVTSFTTPAGNRTAPPDVLLRLPVQPLANPFDETDARKRLKGIQQTLAKIARDKDINPALIYVTFLPMSLTDETRKEQLQKDYDSNETEAHFMTPYAPLTLPKYEMERKSDQTVYLTGYPDQSSDQKKQLIEDKKYPKEYERNRLEIVLVTREGKPHPVSLCLGSGAEDMCTDSYKGNSYGEMMRNITILHGCMNQEGLKGDKDCQEQVEKSSQDLYRWLLGSLESELKKQKITDLSFILPVGLRHIPISALRYTESGKTHSILEKDYSMGVIPSMADTLIYPNRRIQESGLLAMGVSTFQNVLPEIKTAKMQVHYVNKAWRSDKSIQLLNDEVVPKAWKDARDRQDGTHYDLVHLVTHARFDIEEPDNSRIWMGQGTELTFEKFKNENLHKPRIELLVLSACETALGIGGTLIPTDGSPAKTSEDFEYGFAGFAHRLGVKSVLANLWLSADNEKIAKDLIPAFYTSLRQGAKTKAQALKQAQLKLSKQDVDPYFWAGFVLVGNPW